jgi:hypothetical protein
VFFFFGRGSVGFFSLSRNFARCSREIRLVGCVCIRGSSGVWASCCGTFGSDVRLGSSGRLLLLLRLFVV